jgi:hypothetical protein
MIRRSWIATSLLSIATFAVLVAGSASLAGQMIVVTNSVDVIAQMPSSLQQPYTLSRKTSFVQKLADGTTISRTTTGKEARDSQGRTYHENQIEGMGGPARVNLVTYTVFDPIARVNINWNSQNKEANVFHMPEPKPRQPTAARVGGGTGASATGVMGGIGTSVGAVAGGGLTVTPAPSILRTLPDTSDRPKIQRERLDPKNIAGVYCEGNRTTTTYAIGWFGNDKPIVQVQETWTSRELRITMLTVNDDPRTGTRTTEVTELDRSEPDPALFQAPPGYKIHEQNPRPN